MKTYKCKCGEVFYESHTYVTHLAHCNVHLVTKYGSLDNYYSLKNRNHVRGSQKLRERNRQERKQKLQQWISEQHVCEKCGKVMTGKLGSGRFCSRSCANGRSHTEEQKEKISSSVHKARASQIKPVKVRECTCVVCGKIFTLKWNNHRSTCSKECSNKLQSQTMQQVVINKGLHRTVYKRYKFGTYSGINCDSSWELAFVIYNLEHNKDIRRNTQSFVYNINGEDHQYYPDFLIDGIYYEIKGYYTAAVTAKIRDFPQHEQLVVLDRSNIQPYLDYCIEKYGKDFYNLYDRNYPSWMDKEIG